MRSNIARSVRTARLCQAVVTHFTDALMKRVMRVGNLIICRAARIPVIVNPIPWYAEPPTYITEWLWLSKFKYLLGAEKALFGVGRSSLMLRHDHPHPLRITLIIHL